MEVEKVPLPKREGEAREGVQMEARKSPANTGVMLVIFGRWYVHFYFKPDRY
ncbi:hypothetical protein GCM10020331_097500 [Ectobacillus funiculus]